MERINRTLSKIRTPDFRQRYEGLKEEVLANPEVARFIGQNEGLMTESEIEKNLMKLYEFSTQTKHCEGCGGLGQCRNIMPGYEPELVYERGAVAVHYRPCPTKVMEDERKRTERLIKSIYMPKAILRASFADFSLDSPGRMDAFEYAERFASQYKPGNYMKGLYLHGAFGVGKSFLLGAIANHLAEKNIPSLLVYVPEFLREMKQSISDHSLDDKLQSVKSAPILMLDDIGAESMSSWTRDEVLGAILQFRMDEQLPTFFSSNFSMDGLAHHLTYSQRGEEEKMKAGRIMERVMYLSRPIELDGPNRRHQ